MDISKLRFKTNLLENITKFTNILKSGTFLNPVLLCSKHRIRFWRLHMKASSLHPYLRLTAILFSDLKNVFYVKMIILDLFYYSVIDEICEQAIFKIKL